MAIPLLKKIMRKCSVAVRAAIEPALYNLAITLYAAAVRIAAWRNPKAAKLNRGQRSALNRIRTSLDPAARYIWVHTASLGEYEQALPLIGRIKQRCPDKKILLTFFSPTGYELLKDRTPADTVAYLPLDTPRNTRKFVKLVQPEMAIFVKHDVWRNYLRQLYKRNISAYLISATFNPRQLYFRKYGSWATDWLRLFKRIFVQNEKSRILLAHCAIATTETGDTRFDRVADIKSQNKPLDRIEQFVEDRRSQENFTIVFGSSWPSDEDIYIPWLLDRPEATAIIVPHTFDAKRIASLKKRLGNSAVTLSELNGNPGAYSPARILIVDRFGLLSSIYRLADTAYIGGGFGTGIHNINEAAVYGIPVFFGPHHDKFIEATEIIQAHGGESINSRKGFETFANRMMYDTLERRRRGRLAKEYIDSKLGASDKVFNEIFPSLCQGRK